MMIIDTLETLRVYLDIRTNVLGMCMGVCGGYTRHYHAWSLMNKSTALLPD
jgi:hypothetical protein